MTAARIPDDLRSTVRVTVVIPALNEEASLPLVLRDLPAVEQVIVCDNGSTDGTARVAEKAGAVLVSEPRRGYGAVCQRGVAEIEAQIAAGRPAPDIVAFVDADHSDHPDRLPELLAPIIRGEADFVLGSRLLGRREPGAMPPQSVYGNRFACWLMKVLLGGRYTDLGPFRAIRYDALRRLKMQDTGFGWTVEMQLKALQLGLRSVEVPVPYRRRAEGGASKISGTMTGALGAGSKILFLIGKYGLWRRSASADPRMSDRTSPDATSTNRSQVVTKSGKTHGV